MRFAVVLWGEPSKEAAVALGPCALTFDAVLARGAGQVRGLPGLACSRCHRQCSLPNRSNYWHSTDRAIGWWCRLACLRFCVFAQNTLARCRSCACHVSPLALMLQAFRAPELSGSDLATLVYTSGTTGHPKASPPTHASPLAMHSH